MGVYFKGEAEVEHFIEIQKTNDTMQREWFYTPEFALETLIGSSENYREEVRLGGYHIQQSIRKKDHETLETVAKIGVELAEHICNDYMYFVFTYDNNHLITNDIVIRKDSYHQGPYNPGSSLRKRNELNLLSDKIAEQYNIQR